MVARTTTMAQFNWCRIALIVDSVNSASPAPTTRIAGAARRRSARRASTSAPETRRIDARFSPRRCRRRVRSGNASATSSDTNNADVLDLHLHVVKGPAHFVVSELARELAVDLVVMGTVARTGIDGFFMGNTAEGILAELDCSVLTIKPPGFTSPVTLEG